jgi:hypothetical protein
MTMLGDTTCNIIISFRGYPSTGISSLSSHMPYFCAQGSILQFQHFATGDISSFAFFSSLPGFELQSLVVAFKDYAL